MNKLYQLQQLDKKLNRFKNVKEGFIPKKGWLATIREALCMTQSQLATRLHYSKAAIGKIEEAKETIKIETLKKVANELDCDLFYIILPKKNSLMDLIKSRAEKIARNSIMDVAKHMSLEDQAALEEIKEQTEALTDELLHNNLKNLWDYEV